MRPAKLQSDYKKKDHLNCNQVSMNDDKKYQSTKFYKNPVCSHKNCQDNKCVNMWPVEPEMDIQSKEPAMQSSFKKKHIASCCDRNCQSTICYKKKSPVRPMYGNDKNVNLPSICGQRSQQVICDQ